MSSEFVLDKLAAALLTLTDSQLIRLKKLLLNGQVQKAVVNQIESILLTRSAEKSVGGSVLSSPSRVTNADSRDSAESSGRNHSFSHDRESKLKDSFFSLLEDRQFFPSTKDVLQAISQHLKLRYSYEDFKKRGRRDLVSRTWTALQQLSERRRIDLLRDLFETYAAPSENSSAYRDLFEVLTKR